MKNLAVLFPGIGYTIEKPLLQRSMHIAQQLGYELLPVLYSGFPDRVRGDREKMRLSFELALAQARELLSGVDLTAYDSVLFIGKSIGTIVAANIAAERPGGDRVRFVLYTPLEETFSFPLGDAVAFTGSGDPWVGAENSRIPALCAERRIPCFVTPGGNHSLLTGDEEADRRELAAVMLRTELFLRGLLPRVTLLGDAAADTVLLQMVDEREEASLEEEFLQIRERTDGAAFLFAAVRVRDWDRELSPWAAPPVFGGEDFGGGAEETLSLLLEELLPALQRERAERFFYLGGYSLSGLFALWAACRAGRFTGIAAVSPSVWFPGFRAYISEHPPRAGRVYLSLGDREERTRNPVMATVGDAIRAIHASLIAEGVPCVLEWNEGNHFREPTLRTAKGFARLLNDRREQLERIAAHERLLREAEQVVRRDDVTAAELAAVRGAVDRLAAYYGRMEWWQDLYDDESGFLPGDLERGVLSEDGVYNLLERYGELLAEE
ncbi:MAG: DUF4298 domain-containing protein [Oscillospiraceae bacterium]|nr:DUF4298 domain-containing protein [Oscillospiraceae bacterium]